MTPEAPKWDQVAVRQLTVERLLEQQALLWSSRPRWEHLCARPAPETQAKRPVAAMGGTQTTYRVSQTSCSSNELLDAPVRQSLYTSKSTAGSRPHL